MTKKVKIAIDAMGGDNAPKKIIDGIELYSKNNKNIYYLPNFFIIGIFRKII